MQFVYGNYKHLPGEVELSRNVLPNRSPATGTVISYTHQWTLRGTLINQSGLQKTLSKQALALQAAYSIDHQNCGLVFDDGTPVPDAFMWSQNFIGGVMVKQPPVFPQGGGAAGVSHWEYQVVLEATSIGNLSSDLSEWSETIYRWGGGPTFLHLEPLWGMPVKIAAKQNTVFHFVQTGRARGWLSRPSPAPPLFPWALMRSPRIGMTGPRYERGQYVDWGIEWNYEFESATPLIGQPTTI